MNSEYVEDDIVDVLGDYAVYLRKSRKDLDAEARGEGETLARHQKMLFDLAARKKIKIGKIYKEIVSGDSIQERPKIKELLNDVRQKMWKGVLVVEIERLARGDTEDQGIVAKAFKISNTHIITPMKTYDPNNEFDEEYFEFGLFMSRREYKTIKRRLQNGRILSVLEGKYVGGVPPFGYDKIKLKNQKGFSLQRNHESDVVKEVFEIYAYNNLTIGEVAKEANRRGLKPRKNDKWNRSCLKDLLRNPVYIGMIRWNYRKVVEVYENERIKKTQPRNDENEDYILVKGMHEAILDKKTWDIVQEKLKNNSPSVKKSKVIKNPLAGIVICAKCGRIMQRKQYTPSHYRETALMCINPNCDNVSAAIKYVEDKILEALKDWLKEYKLNENDYVSKIDKENIETAEKTFRKLEKELAEQNKKISNVYDFFETGVYTKEMFQERILMLEAKKNEIEKQIDMQKERIRAEEKRLQDKKDIIPKIENIIDVYYQLETAEEKNHLLKTVVRKVLYTKNTKSCGRHGGDPNAFQLDIYPNVSQVN